MSDSQTLRLSVQNMSCASCVGRVERALSALPGVDDVRVNLASETVQAQVDAPERVADVMTALDQAGYPARTKVVRLNVASMSCASCVGRVDKALAALPGVLDVNVNLASETATVTYAEGALELADLLKAAEDAGYPAEPAEEATLEDRSARKQDEARAMARKTALAAAFALPVFLLEMGAHVIPGMHDLIGRTIGHQTSWLIQFVLTTVVLFWPGRAFYTRGFPALLKGAPDMNSLVAVGTSAAYLYSLVALFAPGLLPEGSRAVYFEAAAVIVVLILLGRWMEARAKGRTGAAIQKLLGLQARTARLRLFQRSGHDRARKAENTVICKRDCLFHGVKHRDRKDGAEAFFCHHGHIRGYIHQHRGAQVLAATQCLDLAASEEASALGQCVIDVGLCDIGLPGEDERPDVTLFDVGKVQLDGTGLLCKFGKERFGNLPRDVNAFDRLAGLPGVHH